MIAELRQRRTKIDFKKNLFIETRVVPKIKKGVLLIRARPTFLIEEVKKNERTKDSLVLKGWMICKVRVIVLNSEDSLSHLLPPSHHQPFVCSHIFRCL